MVARRTSENEGVALLARHHFVDGGDPRAGCEARCLHGSLGDRGVGIEGRGLAAKGLDAIDVDLRVDADQLLTRDRLGLAPLEPFGILEGGSGGVQPLRAFGVAGSRIVKGHAAIGEDEHVRSLGLWYAGSERARVEVRERLRLPDGAHASLAEEPLEPNTRGDLEPRVQLHGDIL